MRKHRLVNRFKQSRPKTSMDPKTGVNYDFGDFIFGHCQIPIYWFSRKGAKKTHLHIP